VARSCLGYLSHSCFYHEATNESRKLFAKQGYYAFQDYAMSYWESHVDCLVHILPVLVADPVSGQERMVEATVTLNKFFTVYESSISGENGPDRQHVSRAQLECQPLEQYVLHGTLVAIRAHVLNHQSRPTKDRNVVGIKTLGETLKKIRSIIIELSQDAGSANTMERFYGKTLFKCPRTLCAYFYEGFGDAAFLENHNNRHDRPFVCRSDQQCSSAPFGFASSKDLDKHMRDYHPDHGEPFASLQAQVQASGGSEAVDSSAGPKFRCDICPKRFTRSAALKAHKNGVHLGRRPYPCSICGREFTRKNDTMRHERTQHYRRR
jgi:hypothetical protein